MELTGEELTLLLWLDQKVKDRRAAGLPPGGFDIRPYRHAWPLPEQTLRAAATSLEAKGLLHSDTGIMMGEGIDHFIFDKWDEYVLTQAGKTEAKRRQCWWARWFKWPA